MCRDKERQTILEKMGWRFIRICGSEYYRNPEVTITRVIKELNENGIYPESMVESSPEGVDSELLCVLKYEPHKSLMNGIIMIRIPSGKPTKLLRLPVPNPQQSRFRERTKRKRELKRKKAMLMRK